MVNIMILLGENGIWWILGRALVFRGQHPLTLDDAGRVAVPTKYRKRLRESAGGVLVVTISLMEDCLVVYPFPEWQRIESVLQDMPSTNPQVHAFNHLLVGQATECDMDGNGRILLSQPLREFAGLVPTPENEHLPVRRIRMVGLGRKFELWREDLWEECRTRLLGKVGALTADPQSVAGSLVL